MNITQLKRNIIQQLTPVSDSPALDAELILMHALNKTRAQLFASLNDIPETSVIDALVKRRCQKEPIAYIIGHQPFWTMDLIVTQDTLIPRPETECLVDWILSAFVDDENYCAADLGTGSGAIGLSLALEKPEWKIDATDESYEALAIAKKNADHYHLKNISFYQGNWCAALPQKKYDLIVSNPPYVAENDEHLLQLSFEPQTALVAGSSGLDAMTLIIYQGLAVAEMFKNAGFHEVFNHRDLSDHLRFVTGRL